MKQHALAHLYPALVIYIFLFRVTGFPMPEVTWYKDCLVIQNNPDYQTTFDQGICTLTIEETFTEDSAKFICKAANAAGTAETNATLSVKGWKHWLLA
jgi:hypothetical protein